MTTVGQRPGNLTGVTVLPCMESGTFLECRMS